VQIATKFGAIFGKDMTVTIRGDPEWVRTTCEGSLKRLDVDYIDLYTLARIDSKVPIEITVSFQHPVPAGCASILGFSTNCLQLPHGFMDKRNWLIGPIL